MSIWQNTSTPSHRFETLRDNLKTDVLIIGGGISGLTLALRLVQSGRKVTVIEADRLGLGTTGHSTGNLYSVVDRHLWSIQTKWNPDILRTIVSSRTHAIRFIEETIKKYEIDCDFSRCDFNYYVEQDSEENSEFLKKQFYAAVIAGMETLFKNQLPLPFPATGLTIPNQAQFHPLKYIYGLANLLRIEYPDQCQIFENSPIIEVDGGLGLAKTALAAIQADVIVMATHTPKGIFWVQNHLQVVREHGIAVETPKQIIPPGIFWGVDSPKHSIRSLETNGKNYLIAIGDAYKTGHPGSEEALVQLKNYFHERFKVNEPYQFWAGQAYRSADGLPYIGRQDERLYLMTGFSTDGLVYGTLGAILIDDLIQGVNNAWEKVYALKRFTPLKSAKGMLIEGADNLQHYLKDDLPKPTHVVLGEIPVGEGRVLEGNRDKLAVYRASETRFEVCSAVCTHLKCVVAWNSLEKSWDCPCHGSRFTPEGKVIEGPALRNLEKKLASDLHFQSEKPLTQKNGVPYAPEIKDQTR